MIYHCHYCKKESVPGIGTLLITDNGKINYYCSRKCDANDKMNRNLKYKKNVKG